jgi:hypothetical protein
MLRIRNVYGKQRLQRKEELLQQQVVTQMLWTEMRMNEDESMI